MRAESYSAGDTILSEGEDGDTAFQILDGAVEIKVGQGKREKSVSVLEEGEIFGEMSLIDPGPRSATVVATKDTKCLVTTFDEFMGSLQHDPERGVEFMKTLVRRLRQMNEQVIKMDPSKRGFLGVIRDWHNTVDLQEVDKESLAYWSYRYL